MTASDPVLRSVMVTGGPLVVAQWGEGPNVVVAAHGITANHRCWTPLARHLEDDFTLLAPDLRGRGASAGLGGPYGMARHAEDVVRLLDSLGAPDALVVGHSMGGFVAAALAALHPARVRSVLFVDGGLPLAVPEGLDVDAALAAIVGPAVERLRRTFTGWDEYEAFWRAHPAFARPGAWTPDVEAYLRYDLEGVEPALRSRTSPEAVRGDSEDTLVPDRVAEWVRATVCPLTFLRAERGMFDQAGGLYPVDVVETARGLRPDIAIETVSDVNHYTIVLGERGAAAIAGHVRRQAAEAPPSLGRKA